MGKLHPRRVLVIPYGSGIGDLALQRGTFSAVTRHFSDSEVSVFTPRKGQQFLPPQVRLRSRVLVISAWDRISGLERAWARLGRLERPLIEGGFKLLPVESLSSFPGFVFRWRFDLVIDLLAFFAHAVDMRRDWLPPLPGEKPRHLLDLVAMHLNDVGICVDAAELLEPLPLTDADLKAAHELRAGLPNGKLAILNPHAGSSLKLPPQHFWKQLIAELGSEGVHAMVVRGKGSLEESRAATIAAAGATLLPSLTLPQIVALGRLCESTVSPDTGLLHLAALDGQRWVGLFGSTNPYLLGPYDRSRGSLVIAEPAREPACYTCWQRFTVGSACCPPFAEEGSCLWQIDPKVVANLVLEQVGLAGAT
ncbi:MAG: glycosyltransferase family 9 protein [Dehalococcoidia bacterium]